MKDFETIKKNYMNLSKKINIKGENNFKKEDEDKKDKRRSKIWKIREKEIEIKQEFKVKNAIKNKQKQINIFYCALKPKFYIIK